MNSSIKFLAISGLFALQIAVFAMEQNENLVTVKLATGTILIDKSLAKLSPTFARELSAGRGTAENPIILPRTLKQDSLARLLRIMAQTSTSDVFVILEQIKDSSPNYVEFFESDIDLAHYLGFDQLAAILDGYLTEQLPIEMRSPSHEEELADYSRGLIIGEGTESPALQLLSLFPGVKDKLIFDLPVDELSEFLTYDLARIEIFLAAYFENQEYALDALRLSVNDNAAEIEAQFAKISHDIDATNANEDVKIAAERLLAIARKTALAQLQ